ncbi:MAG: hypothetical protein OXU61_12180 [Gammaproteobacteria bacterium]|nr:hypothetical protein [Gammaproteobacteria bacterium]
MAAAGAAAAVAAASGSKISAAANRAVERFQVLCMAIPRLLSMRGAGGERCVSTAAPALYRYYNASLPPSQRPAVRLSGFCGPRVALRAGIRDIIER